MLFPRERSVREDFDFYTSIKSHKLLLNSHITGLVGYVISIYNQGFLGILIL